MRERKKKLTQRDKPKMHVPIRTCVSCRLKKAKKELIRFVLNEDNQVIIDEYQTNNGRGIYLCDDAACKARFFKNKGVGRLFRVDKPVTIGFKI